MSIREFLKECNDRQVFKFISIYIVSSWVVLQVLVAIWSPLGIPEISVTYLIIALLIGFPIYIYFIWQSKKHLILTDPDDIEMEREVLQKQRKNFKKMYFRSLTVTAVLSLVAAGFIIKNNLLETDALPEMILTERIAVLNFENNTGDKELDVIGKMASDWIIHGITEYDAGEVISSQNIENYIELLGTKIAKTTKENVITSFFQTNKIIKGAFFVKDNNLVFQCSVQDSKGNKSVKAFKPLECPKDDALNCIEQLKKMVVVYLTMQEENELGIEDKTPNFEAYQNLLLAEDSYDDKEKYLRLLNEAIALDSTFFMARIDLAQYYWNQKQFKKVDSMVTKLRKESRVQKRQKYFLNFLEALVEGKNDAVFRNFKYEYENVPMDLETNSTYMVLALQYINRPDLLEDAFKENTMSEYNLENCIRCAFRYFTMGLAYNELGEFDKTIELLEPVYEILDRHYIIKTLARAYAESGDIEKVNYLIERLDLDDDLENKADVCLHVGKTYLVKGNPELAKPYLKKVVDNPAGHPKHKAYAQFLLGNYEEADKHLNVLLMEEKNSQSSEYISLLAISSFKNGKIKESEDLISKLDELSKDYDYGNIEYAYARYYLALGKTEEAMRQLQKSVAKGKKYYPDDYQNDPLLSPLRDLQEFESIMTYWH